MAWYNSLRDLGGDLGSIIQGHNPMNNNNGPASPVGRPDLTGAYTGPQITPPPQIGMLTANSGQKTMHFDPNSTQPVGMNIDPSTLDKVKGWLSQNWDRLGSGMSDYEKWILALQTVGGLASAYVGYQQGQQNNAMNQQQLAEKAREFDASQAQQQNQYNTNTAPGLAKSIDAAPLRDRASYMLQARMGLNPTPFSGAGLGNPGQQGGIDMSQLAAANAGYSPGAGGTNPSVDIQKKILASMGYPYGGTPPVDTSKPTLKDKLDGK